jgi:AcrR family transcriptional regulator
MAWSMVRAEGLTALSLTALARAVGMEPQSLYTYFSSKHAIYDAMFADGNRELLARLQAMTPSGEPREMLRQQAQVFVEFSSEDPARQQLLFARIIPDFEPSPESYAIAIEVVKTVRNHQAAAGLTGEAQFDLWTALVAGLASQQMANDPGGDRYIRLIADAVDMYVSHIFGPDRPPS